MNTLRGNILAAASLVLAAVLAWGLPQGNLADRAYNNGFQAGYKLGQSDARANKDANFENTSAYRRATDGYNEDMGSLEVYRSNYRAGYADGYKEGFTKAGGTPPAENKRLEERREERRPDIDTQRPGPYEPLKRRVETPPPPPPPQNVVLPEGTTMRLRLSNTLSTRTNRQGDRFTATVSEPVYVQGSSDVAIPVGSTVNGSISQSERPGRVKGTATLHLRYESITLPGGREMPFEASLVSIGSGSGTVDEGEGTVKGKKSTGRDAATVGGGTALGAIIGGIAGGGRGAAIGAGVGAGVGTGAVLTTRGKDIDLPGGSIMEVRLMRSLDVRLDNQR